MKVFWAVKAGEGRKREELFLCLLCSCISQVHFWLQLEAGCELDPMSICPCSLKTFRKPWVYCFFTFNDCVWLFFRSGTLCHSFFPPFRRQKGFLCFISLPLMGRCRARELLVAHRMWKQIFAWWVLNCPCIYGFEVAPLMRLKLVL